MVSSGVTYAQSTPGISPDDAIDPEASVEGAGIKVGEGTVLHPVFGVETGFVSNVFYEESQTNSAGLLRLLAQLSAGSLSQQRLAAPGVTDQPTNAGAFQYRFHANLSYDFYLSSNDAVQEQGGLGAGLLFRGLVNPNRPWSFGVLEEFQRVIRETNFESPSNTNRIINHLNLSLSFTPTGRTVSGILHYDNTIDIFESDNQDFADRMQHMAGIRVNHLLFPKTRLYADVSVGYYSGLGEDSTKVTSYPLITQVGIQTALTVATSIVARAGYTNGFYTEGPSYSAALFGVQLGWRYSPLGSMFAQYDYTHNDSINANFYRDHKFGLNIEQRLAPVSLIIHPEVMLREYQGLLVMGNSPTRKDLILSGLAEVRYSLRDWMAASINYQISTVQTDFRYMPDAGGPAVDPSYVRHEILAGLRAAL
ncbi:MAG: hypothetical protein M3680_00370 [Myxococcota bacterium]|nr:hypothetical protein [Myxococcota bacterium]